MKKGDVEVPEKQDARAYANEIFTHVNHENPDTTDLGVFLAKVIAELLELSPGAREHISDFLIVDLCEELGRRGHQDAVRVVLEVQSHWSEA
jgi:hypothetical protein